MTLVVLVVAAGILVALAYWGYEIRETTRHVEAELQALRADRALLPVLLAQTRAAALPNQLPVGFLLEEPECAQRLLSHLRLKNVRIVYSGASNASTALLNGSTHSRIPGQTESSP